MSPVRQFERTYHAIRSRLMAGAWPPGMQLVTPRVASELGVSQSPVRECLSHLAGERMVDFWPSLGFFVPQHDEAGLRDLFDCHLLLLRTIVMDDSATGPLPDIAQDDHAERTAALFEGIAGISRNTALVETVRGLGDRLHVYRRFDPLVFPQADEELSALARAFSIRMASNVRRDLLTRYHVSRKIEAGRYIQFRAELAARPT